MLYLPYEIEHIIFEFANIHCHGCLKCLRLREIKKKQGKWYYCSKECYEFT
jgi:hypothetical protein